MGPRISAGVTGLQEPLRIQRSKGGSTPDPVKAEVLEKAKKNKISPRTAERAFAAHRAPETPTQPKRTFVTCPECSSRTADLDKHIATKHKNKRRRKLQVVKDSGPKYSPPTKKQALGVLQNIALNVDSAAAGLDACGDLATLATYDEAQHYMDLVADGSRRLIAFTRQFTQERDALVARKGGSR